MSGPGTPPAARVVELEIAQISVRLSAERLDLPLVVPAAVEPFVRPVGGPPDIELSVDWMGEQTERAGLAGSHLVFDSDQLWRLFRGPGPAKDWIFRLASGRFGPRAYRLARLTAGFERGTIYVDRRSAYAEGVYPLEYPLDELLWIHMLGARRGACLHACGVVDVDGAGYLFVGQSGAGKSTTARLWTATRPISILSDDRVIVRADGDGFTLHGTPWHGDGPFARPGNAPLRAIFLLAQAPRTELLALPPARAVGRLLAASFLPFHDAQLVANAAELLSAAVLHIPCFELRFTPDASAVEIVAQGRSRGPELLEKEDLPC